MNHQPATYNFPGNLDRVLGADLIRSREPRCARCGMRYKARRRLSGQFKAREALNWEGTIAELAAQAKVLRTG